MKTAAIYARVSSDQQKEDNTIASQTAALKELGAALLKRRPAARNLAVGADVFGDLCTRHASPVMRRGSLRGELAVLGSCVVAPARSEMPGSWPSRH